MKIIYTGTDNLDFSVKGKLKTKLCKELKSLKELAQETSKEQLFTFGDFKGFVLPNGAGGYKYIINNELFSITIKDNVKEETPLRVSIRSLLLANKGFAGAKKEVLKQLKNLIDIEDFILSRVDICLDVQDKKFKLKPENIITKRGTTKSVHAFDWFGRKEIETVRIGKMPNMQICIYNKSKQVDVRPKADFWRYIWNDNPNYDPKAKGIWRFELRWGREYLRSRNINDFEDLEREIAGMIERTMSDIFMVEEKKANITRDSVRVELWQNIKEALKNYARSMLSEIKLNVDLASRLQGAFNKNFKRTENLLLSNIMSLCILQGQDFTLSNFSNIVENKLNELDNNEKYKECIIKQFNYKKVVLNERFMGLVA